MTPGTSSPDFSALLRQAYLELKETRARIEELERAKSEPIAIVGMACRFPGDAIDAESYWRLLEEGREAISEVPRERWAVDALYHPDPDRPGGVTSRWGGFLRDVDVFDPALFQIAPREAARMDPHHRLLLQVVWEALEDAGLAPSRLAGTRTGVFIGLSTNDYTAMEFNDAVAIDAYTGTGASASVAAGRISYQFDFRGPSLAVDTACSSSLVAAHLACHSLRSGESDFALAGGVGLLLAPFTSIAASRLHFLAPDGRCKTFDARADGFVRGEGCGIIVLRRLSDAIESGDRILALIRGSAVNQDGRSAGLTAPNLSAQQEVIRGALANAGIAREQVSYIEAHGTGTALGDPIEVEALKSVYGLPRSQGQSCVISAVKTNIGHLEAAAGVAGLIKVVLSLRHHAIPAVLHHTRLNPNIVLKGTPFVIPTALYPWPGGETPHVAAVSSFGMSGTNAHMILEEASPMPRTVPAAAPGPSLAPRFRLVPLSAHTGAALGAHAAAWHTFFSAGAGRETPLEAIAYTASRRRAHLEHRLAVIARTREQLIGSLAAFVEGASAPDVHTSQPTQSRGPVFVFTGQGGQWPGMGRQLLEHEPVFRASIERTAEVFHELTGWSLLRELNAGPAASRLGEIDVCQPVLFAVEVALADLWRSWGIEPVAVVGHSRGEITASCVAGALSLEAAARIMCRRSRLMRRLSGQGGMAVVGLPGAELFRLLAPYQARLAVAVLQSPGFTVVSGEQNALEELLRLLEGQNVFCRRIKVDVASHCPQIEVLRDDLLAAINGIEPRPGQVPFYSTVTAGRLPGNLLHADYWYRNLREPVRFAETLADLADQGFDTFLEISPHPILLTAVEQVYEQRGQPALLLPSLHRDEDERLSLLRSLSALHVRGHAVRWEALEPGGQCVTLPRFPWQNQRYPVRAASINLPGAVLPDDTERRGHRQTRDDGLPVGSLDEVAPTGETGGTAAAFSRPEDRLYELAWHPQDPRRAADAELPDAWLILADRRGTAQALATRLEGRGTPCLVAFAGGGQTAAGAEAQVGDGLWRLDPASRDAYEQILAAAGARFGGRRLGIVHLWSLDGGARADLSDAELREAQVLGCFSLLHLVQALPSADTGDVRLWLVTRGAQRVSTIEGPGQPEQSPLWGAGRVVAREHPELWGGLIDLDPAGGGAASGVAEGSEVRSRATTVDEALTLLEVIEAGDGEDEAALRGGRRYVPRLRPAGALLPPAGEPLRADATYLIVGGLGGIGLEVARWMVERGARTIVLACRSGATDRARPVLETLEQAGCRIVSEAVDVSNRDSVAALLGRIERTLPPLRGIVHSAAVLNDGVMLRLRQEQFETAFAPKVAGAWNLHTLTRHLPLDFFTLFSSATALIGLLGHATYAASNAFLDSLAHCRRALGLPAQTINWGVWEQVGVAVRLNAQREMPGAGAITATEGLWLLERLLRLPGAQWVVLPMNWAEYFRSEAPGKGLPLLAELRGALQATLPQAAFPETGLRHQLKAASPGERLHLLSTAIHESVATVLGFGRHQPIDPARGFFQMGMDSLRAIELKNRLQTLLGRSLPSTLVFDNPTISALSNHLLRILFPVALAARSGGSDELIDARMKTVLGQVKTLDPEELRRMLRRPPI